MHLHPHVRLSACISMAPNGRISVIFDIGGFGENLCEAPICFKIGQTYRARFVTLLERFTGLADINFPSQHCCATLSIFMFLQRKMTRRQRRDDWEKFVKTS